MQEKKEECNAVLAARIAQRRQELGYSLGQIAIKVGLAKSTVQRYEKGIIKGAKRPVVESIAHALSTSAEYLLGETDDPAPVIPGADDFTYALFNETQPLTQENREKLLEMARFFRQQQEKG